jgi:predicted MFS family arabinose efflux permease
VSATSRAAALAPVLIFTTMVTAIISSLGAPLIPSVSNDLHVSLSAAQWSLTATLLVGAVSAPIMGRLGDGRRRRETLIGGLGLVTLGGVIAALAPSLGVLVTGRALQGIGLGLIPLTMAAARDHLPRERVAPTIALLSVCAAAGVGAGYPISGLIADRAGLHAAFWFGALVSALALVCAAAVVPSSKDRPPVTLDVLGAVLLTAGLVALLLAIAEGNAWGWGSVTIVALLAGALVLLATWIVQQLRSAHPLVELRLMRHPAVLTGNASATVLGVAMYTYLSCVTEFVQTPKASGYGFSASVVEAGLCLVPLSITSLVASRLLPRMAALVGARAVLPAGCLIVAGSGAFIALFHAAIWEAFLMMAIVGVGLGATFAAIPGLLVRSVPERETGSVMGFYQVVRYVGFSLGSALTAAILASHTERGGALPSEGGYTLALWVGVAICIAAAAVAWLLPAHGRAGTPADEQLATEDAELASAGLAGVTEELAEVR